MKLFSVSKKLSHICHKFQITNCRLRIYEKFNYITYRKLRTVEALRAQFTQLDLNLAAYRIVTTYSLVEIYRPYI